MPGVFHEIAPTFAGGELTPRMYSRVDMEKYKTALKTARNGIIHPQGGFSSRTGFRYVAATKYSDKKCRLIAFQFSMVQSYILEFGHQYCRFYRNGAQVTVSTVAYPQLNLLYHTGDQVQFQGTVYEWRGGISGLATWFTDPTDINPSAFADYNVAADEGWKNLGAVVSTPLEIPTPYTETDLPSLKWAQSGDTIYFAHPNHAPQMLVRNGDTNWVLSAFPFINGPFKLENSDITSHMTLLWSDAGGGTLSSDKFIFQTTDIGKWFQVTMREASQSINASLTVNQATGPIWALKQWKLSTVGTWVGTVNVQVESSNGVFSTIASLTSTAIAGANYNTSGDIPYDYPVQIRVQVSLSSGTANITLSADPFSYDWDVQVSSYGTAHVVGIIPSSSFGGWELSAGSTFEWSEGSWSATNGWPSVVGFYGDRLAWASSSTEPITTWLSKTGVYVDYGVSQPLVDSDAIDVNLPSRKFNGINNLVPMLKLLALTASGEFSIGPGSTGILAPTSVDQRPQGYRGCSVVTPIVIGNQALYIQPQGTVVRNISYQFYTDSFTGDNLSLMAEHLFSNFTIQDMTYCQEPDSIGYFVRSDGALLALTYLLEQQVVAWTHFDTLGSFISCASIPTSNYDELWVVVERAFGTFIERLAQPLPTFDTKDQFHVDCGIDYNGAATTAIAGLDHLNGQSVIALADGNVQGPFTVVGGSITLTEAASLIHIGLPYTADLETLNIEQAGQDGTMQGRRQRVAQVTVRFLYSLGGSWGPDAGHLHPIVPTPPATLDSARPLFSGDIKAPITSSWSTNGRVFLRQSDPLPFNVTGLFPVIEAGNL